MWPHKREDREEMAPPCQAWLAAYVDGELPEPERARVEAWLAQNPEARAEVEAQRRLKALYDRCPVPEPDPLAWDDLLGRVELSLRATDRTQARPAGRHFSAWRWAAGAAAVAAAVLLTLWLGRPAAPPGEGGTEEEVLQVASGDDVVIDDMDPADARALVVGRPPAGAFVLGPGEQLEVATDDEVTILCMDEADAWRLVVGEPPAAGPLALATREEVQVDRMEPLPAEETMPYLHAPEGGWPMVVAPLKASRKDGPP